MVVWHWIVNHGLYESIVSTFVFIILGQLLLWRNFLKLWRLLQHIRNLLDTSEPGGLTDVVEELQTNNPNKPRPKE